MPRPTRAALKAAIRSNHLVELLLSVVAGQSPIDSTQMSLLIEEVGGTYVDHSGTIQGANTSQPVMTANASRRYLLIQNNGATDLWVNVEGGAAAAGGASIRIPAGAWFEPPVPPTGAIAAFSATLGLPFTAKEV